MRQIDLVVFDMAGTTVYDGDAVASCFQAALKTVGVDAPLAAVNAVMGLPKGEAVRRLLSQSTRGAELLPQADAILGAFIEKMCHHYRTNPSVREVPGASNTFALLRDQGIQVGLNTGFGREIVNVLLERLGWREGSTIDATVCSDEVAHGRPQPDMILHLMQRLGVRDASRVAKVGDTPSDLLEGTNAQCGLVVGVTGGTHTRQELSRYPHHFLIETVADFPALLG